jgi:hypothetical protein
MDDVSKIQKINNLARELMKHGQANSMEDAMRMASEQVESGSAPQDSAERVDPSEIEMPEATASEGTAEPVQEVQAESAGAVEEVQAEAPAVENAAVESVAASQPAESSADDDVMRKLEELSAKLTSVIAEVVSLKEDVRKLKESPVTPPLPKKEAKEGQTQFKQEGTPAAAPEPKKEEKPAGEGHVRSGKYNPEDVSIEKFFYYGK